jgi:hypothetical protein
VPVLASEARAPLKSAYQIVRRKAAPRRQVCTQGFFSVTTSVLGDPATHRDGPELTVSGTDSDRVAIFEIHMFIFRVGRGVGDVT